MEEVTVWYGNAQLPQKHCGITSPVILAAPEKTDCALKQKPTETLKYFGAFGQEEEQQNWILIWGKLKTLLEEWIYIKCCTKIFYIWNLQITIIDKSFQYRNIDCCPDILIEVSFSPPMIY